jgi:hypothetical protein
VELRREGKGEVRSKKLSDTPKLGAWEAMELRASGDETCVQLDGFQSNACVRLDGEASVRLCS